MSRRFAVVVAVLLLTFSFGIAEVWAQSTEAATTVTFDWKTVIAALINSVLVLVVVQLINMYWPAIREQYPMIVPIVATVIGPAVGWAQSALLTKLGVAVDFSPVLAAFSGAAAVTLHQVGRQTQNFKTMRRLARQGKPGA